MTDYEFPYDSIKGSMERHVLEVPERHEKIDDDYNGTGELEDPHCDWCWDAWPCVTSILAKRLYDLGER